LNKHFFLESTKNKLNNKRKDILSYKEGLLNVNSQGLSLMLKQFPINQTN